MSKSKASRVQRDESPEPQIWPAAAEVTDAIIWPQNGTAFWQKPLAPLADPESELSRAIFTCQAQEKFLQKAREALDRMLELAILVQQSVSDERDKCLDEFDTLITFLEKLAETEIEGVKLFKSPNLIVNLPDQSDTLVLPGVDLNHDSFRAALRANVSDPISAGAALGTIQRAVR